MFGFMASLLKEGQGLMTAWEPDFKFEGDVPGFQT
jgi:hypothetical protein